MIAGSSAISETGVPVDQGSILGLATIGDATSSNADGLGLTLATDGTIVSIGLPIIEAGGPSTPRSTRMRSPAPAGSS